MSEGASIVWEDLKQALPFHMLVSPDGLIQSCGHTLAKMMGAMPQGGQLAQVLTVLRPKTEVSVSSLSGLKGQAILAKLQGVSSAQLRAHVIVLKQGGLLINFGLGADVRKLVADCNLTMRDFTPNDPTIEMLFLIEANAAAIAESDKLTAHLEDARAKAEELAATDKLTGLFNRRAMDAQLERMIVQPHLHPFGLMHLDLDYFKAVNDTRGHAAGDYVLQKVAEVLRSQVRKNDIVARVGGDEFVLIFPQCPDLETLDRIAQRIIRNLEKPITFEGQPCRISASIGTTVSSFYTAPGADQMLNDADRALYRSKEAGRARHTVFSPKAPDILASP